MKTKVKRVKNARRNRRFRRTQRGGGWVNDAMRHFRTLCLKNCHDEIMNNPSWNTSTEVALKRCNSDCEKNYSLTIPHDGATEATENGWFIDYDESEKGSHGLHLLHTSWDPVKANNYHHRRLSYQVTPEIAKNLHEMPNPLKTYVVGNLHLKLQHTPVDKRGFGPYLQWLDQYKQIHPFNIESPLKIGDKTAVELAGGVDEKSVNLMSEREAIGDKTAVELAGGVDEEAEAAKVAAMTKDEDARAAHEAQKIRDAEQSELEKQRSRLALTTNRQRQNFAQQAFHKMTEGKADYDFNGKVGNVFDSDGGKKRTIRKKNRKGTRQR